MVGTARSAPWREVNENDFIVLISERLPCYLIVKRRQERGVAGVEVNSAGASLGREEVNALAERPSERERERERCYLVSGGKDVTFFISSA